MDWRPVQGYEGRYEVSSTGLIRSHVGLEPRIMKTVCINGYTCVILRSKFGKYHTCMVHRMVAMAFIPNPQGRKYVSHVDGDNANNRVENLRWVDYHGRRT